MHASGSLRSATRAAERETVDPRYTQSMTATTIKVPVATRDRLKERAARRGETLAVQLDHLLDLAEREDRFAALRSAMAAMTPAARDAYERERDEWLDADLG